MSSRYYVMEPLHVCSGHVYDCVMVAGGSDARAYQILREAQKLGITFETVCLFDFAERKAEPDPKIAMAYRSYSTLENASRFRFIDCSITDPSGCLKSLGEARSMIAGSRSVAIDISCFTKPYFFVLLKHLQNCGIKEVEVFYTEPMTYRLPKSLYGSYHSSSGPLSVMEMPGFPGMDSRGKKSVLIVLLGFDGELSTFITDELAPSIVIAVNGFPAYAPKFKDVSLINNEKLLGYAGLTLDTDLARANNPFEVMFARANNPFEVFNLLAELKNRFSDTLFNIAPLGTKPMALGACMFALYDSSVRVVYPMPSTYTNVTTDSCWYSWRYIVPLAKSGSGSFVAQGLR